MSDLSNMDYLRKAAPSIFAEKAYNAMSDKYAFIPTIEVVERLGKEGFYPSKVSENRVRLNDKKGFAKHLIRFRNNDVVSKVGDTVPEIVLTNSHDGSSSFQMSAGLYRLVCSNGLTVGNDLMTIRQRHTGDIGDIIEGVFRIVDDMPNVLETVEEWKTKQLSASQEIAFARAAIPLRWDVDEHGNAPVNPSHLLRPVRSADTDHNVWTAFNRVQEHIIKGGVAAIGSTGRRRHSKSITSVNEDQRLNKALWTLAAELAATV